MRNRCTGIHLCKPMIKRAKSQIGSRLIRDWAAIRRETCLSGADLAHAVSSRMWVVARCVFHWHAIPWYADSFPVTQGLICKRLHGLLFSQQLLARSSLQDGAIGAIATASCWRMAAYLRC